MDIFNKFIMSEYKIKIMEKDDKSLHILNAVSPAPTCSIPFSKYICKDIKD